MQSEPIKPKNSLIKDKVLNQGKHYHNNDNEIQ